MDFGLGLVLSVTDNASAGLNNAVQSLSNLTSVAERACGSLDNLDSTASLLATSQSASIIGDGFIKAGNGMLGMFNSLIAKTQSVGSEYENFGITLSALGMDSETALKKLFQFANKSPLEVGDVKEMIATLQAQGINAFEETTGAISHTRQEFLAYLTDLKSFKPEVANTRFKMAIQNYIGSGEKKMMRTVFDMGDIEKIIGHGVSDTAEGRMQDIVEMVENKGLTGLSKELSQSWQGVASNIDDAFTRIFYSVANDGGVFEKLKKSFVDLANIIIDLPEEELASLGKTIGDALNTIVTPLTKIVNWAGKAVKSMISLAQTNPALLKWGIVLTTISGIATILTGVVFKLIGSLASFTLVMQNIGGTVSQVSKLFKLGLSDIKAHILPLVFAVGLLALVWATDFGGIRTMTLNFVNNISKSFDTAKTNVEGSVQGLHESIKTLEGRDDFWSNITIGLMQLYGTFKFVAEAWNNYELSDDSFKKAEELGIIPLISRILDLKYRFEKFKKGFVSGWKEIGSKVQGVISELKPKLEGTIFESLINGVTDLMTALTNNDPKAWEDLGNKIGKFSAALLVVAPIIKGVIKVLSLFKKFTTALSVLGKSKKDVSAFGQTMTSTGDKVSKAVNNFVKLGVGLLMIAGAFSMITLACNSMSDSGGGSIAVLVLMSSMLAGFIAVMVKFSAQIEQGSKGMIMLGASLLLISTSMMIFANACVLISSSGTGAIVVFGLMMAGIIGLVAVVGAFGNKLLGASAGLIAFGAGLLLVGAGLTLITNSAIAMSNAGSGAYVALAVLMGVLIAIAVACSTFAVQLAIGGAALAVFGAGLVVVGAGLTLVATSLAIVTACMPILAQYGLSGAVAITALGGALVLLNAGLLLVGASATVAGAGGTAGAVGITALAGAIVVLRASFGKSVDKLNSMANAIQTIADKSNTASKGVSNITTLKGTFKQLPKSVDSVNTSFKTFSEVVNTSMTSALQSVVSTFTAIKSQIAMLRSSMNFQWSLPKLKMPHFTVKGSFKTDPPSVPEYSVNWYAKGGVFESPSVIGVGEKGKEAVMPLEKNLGWISSLASMISSNMNVGSSNPEVVSVDTSSQKNMNSGESNSNVITKNVTNNSSNTNNAIDKSTTTSGSVDNSIHFESGSIVIQAKEFSSSEAEKFAKLIMQKIQRMREINDMLQYKS